MKISYFILSLCLITLTSCSDFLNEPPLDRITENDVWNDKALMDSYFFQIYENMPWDYLKDFENGGAGDGAQREVLSDIARSTYSWTAATNTFRPGNWGTSNNTWPMDWWGYFNVWKINYSIENLEQIAPGILSEEEYNNRLGEMYFLRAFCYFEMAKRYGGVPIILEAQDPETTPEEEYFPSRNTEKEVYDQVLQDTEAAFDLLPEQWTAQPGRASKWAAKALESRAALYAASIAKYGTVQLDGIVGLPAGDAVTYYERSLSASQAIILESGYRLFNEYSNPTENYTRLFLDETDNETIFKKIWIPFEKGHSYDWHNVPYSYRLDWGSSMSPTKQFVDSYEVLSTGLLPAENGSDYNEANPYENRDPRLKATVLLNNEMFQGSPVEIWYGTEINGEINTDSGTGIGKDGFGVHPDATKTGFYVRKYLEDGASPLYIPEYYSGQNSKIFRLAEIYLNAAEAAFELNNIDLARDYVEPVRNRAGLTNNLRLESYSGNEFRDRLRNERKLELAFEDHRYWDVRRWRIAEEVLSIQVQGVKTLRHLDGFGNATFTYETIDAESEQMNFFPRHYYLPIGLDRTNNNSKLVENPGY